MNGHRNCQSKLFNKFGNDLIDIFRSEAIMKNMKDVTNSTNNYLDRTIETLKTCISLTLFNKSSLKNILKIAPEVKFAIKLLEEHHKVD